jgi:hypothetical protein
MYQPDSIPNLLTPADVGKWLSWPTARVVRLARQGKIPCIELPGGHIIFDVTELASWIEDQKTARRANR